MRSDREEKDGPLHQRTSKELFEKGEHVHLQASNYWSNIKGFSLLENFSLSAQQVHWGALLERLIRFIISQLPPWHLHLDTSKFSSTPETKVMMVLEKPTFIFLLYHTKTPCILLIKQKSLSPSSHILHALHPHHETLYSTGIPSVLPVYHTTSLNSPSMHVLHSLGPLLHRGGSCNLEPNQEGASELRTL